MDYEILGCLVGLALWQNCTLDLPLHPHTCAMLFGFPPESIQTLGEIADRVLRSSLADLDPDLYRNKVEWLLANSVDDLGISFSDSLGLGHEDSQDESRGGT
eukprot:g15692.t1